MPASLFTPDHKLSPYWWDRVPRPAVDSSALPARADVVVVGSGYTGLHAALQTARGGRHTLVLDAEDAGWGCSTRNGGQVSTSVKPGFAELARRHGAERAREIVQEGQRSLAWFGQFVAAEKIDCDFGVVGRFHAAHNAAQFDAACARRRSTSPRAWRSMPRWCRAPSSARELGSDAYWGGVVYRAACQRRPGALPPGPAAIARSRRRTLVGALPGHAPSSATATASACTTPRGTVQAREVVDRHQRLHRHADAVAAPPRHPHRQLHHRHRGAAAGVDAAS